MQEMPAVSALLRHQSFIRRQNESAATNACVVIAAPRKLDRCGFALSQIIFKTEASTAFSKPESRSKRANQRVGDSRMRVVTDDPSAPCVNTSSDGISCESHSMSGSGDDADALHSVGTRRCVTLGVGSLDDCGSSPSPALAIGRSRQIE